MNRSNGRAQRGQRAVVMHTSSKGANLHLITATTSMEIVAFKTKRGAFKGADLKVAYRAARTQGQPAVLSSLDLDRAGYYQDFVSLVQRDVDKCRGNDQRLLLHADAGRPMIIWAADRNLNALNGSSGLIYDATFAVAPKGWQQLWVILIEKQGYYIPAVFILMARKTQEEHERALLKLRDVLTEHISELSLSRHGHRFYH
ncbi:hypothetical protein Pmar_PMAR003424 [Perkinsus marinus ATCC 50983]|uniref:MULE transposase domain-containing protein n=1 Tax=Perkinsus marinus (strain ATCC 50983 / TXsc) TaxID=423536 RepID=C5KHA3_PERM5|nr:hypothetical protein Pmar_PMAR003424 [Perkinsus marinus ATCC 50983]EER15965.1 hypothetical protein Pmar_PMAR003424 [Perkinsus marinus ATCC 50983]|eukprot:XP_002784169.1 hypothetical protein Pmar_PMAR003424 [Perkinsus marinus ATCC 50983]